MACKLEEERLLKQRAKIHWLKVGDQILSFFIEVFRPGDLRK